MRNRQLIANWVLDHVNPANPEVEIIEVSKPVGNPKHDVPCETKHYMRVNDYEGLRVLYGQLLAIIQRITSTGDYEAAKEIVERYAVKVNPELHREMRARYQKLNLAPYKGFVNPVYEVKTDNDGHLSQVSLNLTEGYTEQHLRYSRLYSPLPTWND